MHEAEEFELGFNLSAFIQAWRSVFDVLLYDYAEQYFRYSEARKIKITKITFKEIATVLDNHGNSKPKQFIDWHEKKESKLGKLHFWHLRKFFVHRGGKKTKKGSRKIETLEKTKPVEIYVPPSAISGDAISVTSVSIYGGMKEVETEEELTIAGMPETVIHDESDRVYAIMEEIVKEARKNF